MQAIAAMRKKIHALNHKGYRQDILKGMLCGINPIILHVGTVPFETYMWNKGTALWQSRLFDTIAIPAPEAVLLTLPRRRST